MSDLTLFLLCFLGIWNIMLTISAIIVWVNIKAWAYSTHQIVGPKEVFNFGTKDVPDFEPVTDDLREKLSEEPENEKSLGE